jgi:putative transposase
MARPLRLDQPGLTHHITSRGNERRKIFRDDTDCLKFLDLLGQTVLRFGWILHSYVLMINHFHLVLETPEATLSDGMHWLNGTYAAWFNKRHKRSGHLFQGRFHSFLVDKQEYLMDVMRYVALNPVRARLAARPEDYRWSSYRDTAGYEAAPPWLTTSDILSQIRDTTEEAQEVYRQYVCQKIGVRGSIWDKVVNQIYLGTSAWVEKMRVLVESEPRSDEHPRAQRTPGRPDVIRVAQVVASVFDITRYDLESGHGGAPRMMVAWLARNEGLSRLRAIAAKLHLRSCGNVSNLAKACGEELSRDSRLRLLVDRCLRQLRPLDARAHAEGVIPYWPALPLPSTIRETATAWLA